MKEKTATILARIIKDEDMPLGTQLLIGNTHLAQQETVIDYREMTLYMNTDTKDRVAVPFSVGELLFLHKKFQVRADQDFSCPADSSGMIRVQIFANELPFFFEQPTLLYMEQTNMSAISIPRAILRLDQQSTATLIVVNISGHPIQIVEGEILGDATLCSDEILDIAIDFSDSNNQAFENSDSDSLPDLIPIEEDSDSDFFFIPFFPTFPSEETTESLARLFSQVQAEKWNQKLHLLTRMHMQAKT